MPTLRWLTRDDDVRAAERVPYRLLEEVPELGYGDRGAGNMLIQGDNLEALKALLPYYAGQVKCIYIDPPYNTGQAFDHYDDNLEHSIWLATIYPRLEYLRDLLADDGVLFCQLNDDEAAYARVILDEIFGRTNFLNQVTVKMKQTSGASGGGEDKRLKKNVEYITIFAKNRNSFQKFNDFFEEEDLIEFIEDMKASGKSWKYTRIIRSFGTKQFMKETSDGSGEPIKIFSHEGVKVSTIKEVMIEEGLSEADAYFKYHDRIFRDTNAQSSIRTRVMEATQDGPDFLSIEYTPRSGRSKGKLTTLYYKGRNRDLIAWLSDISTKSKKRIVKREKLGTFWDGFPLNNLTKEGSVHFPGGKKPEALVKTVLELATGPGDLVLDSFLGSGTTAAVAQKMGRRYIGIEMGDHAKTLCAPRMRRVVDGEQGGISKAQNWRGGGGFRFYRLGPPVFDEDGSIQPDISFPVLAAHIWFSETGGPWTQPDSLTAFIGSEDTHGYALLYNGILGDKSVSGGNVLTRKTLYAIRAAQGDFQGSMTVYGERTALSETTLKTEKIEFKQTPYDVRARK